MALTTDILGYWKLDESSGNAADATGNGNTLTDTNTVSYGPALIANGLDLGSSNTNKALIRSAGVGYTGSNNPGSISLWVKVNSQPGTNVIYTLASMNGGSNPNNTRMMVRYVDNSGTKQVAFIRQSSAFNEGTTYNVTLSTSAFTHVVMTYNGSTILGYVNGVQQASLSSSSSSGGDSPTFGLGANPEDSTQQPSSVWIDEVGTWSRELTSAEVTQLYNGGVGVTYPFVAGPTTVKTWNGIPLTNIKTVNGVAIASVKSINGIT